MITKNQSEFSFSSGYKLFVLFGLTVLFALFVNSCQVGQNNELKALRIGIASWPGFDVALYGRSASIFKKRGLDVTFVRFNNQQDSSRAMLRGALDGAFVSLWDAMQVDPRDDKPVFVLVTNISNGADGIVTKSGIKSVKDLKGKLVGTKLGTVNHLILLEALRSRQIKPATVKIEDISNETAAERIKQGKLDAAVIWEPLLSKTAKEIKGNIVYTTKEVNSLVIDGLVMRAAIAAEKKSELMQFILALFDVMYAVENKPAEVFDRVSKELGQSKETFAKDYAGLKKGDITMQQQMFDRGRLSQAIEQITQLLQEDPRHGRIIRKDVEINSELVNTAIEIWQP